MNSPQHHVVFIDGICVLCNRLSRILIRLDKKKQFLFSTLDSPLRKKPIPSTKRRFNFGVQSKRDDLHQKQSDSVYHSSASICQMDWHIVSHHSDFYLRPFI